MRRGVLDKLTKGLAKTRESLAGGLKRAVSLKRIDPSFWEGLEETLIGCDMGVAATERILGSLRKRVRGDPEEAIALLKEEMVDTLRRAAPSRMDEVAGGRGRGPFGKSREPKAESRKLRAESPWVIMVAGVNGTGKTTTIAKLARLLRDRGEEVLLAACDTYRPAAQEQLRIWAERVGVDFVGSKEGADPASVAYDALGAALSRNKDYLIIDTAGRVHTRVDLMEELRKIGRVLGKRLPGAPQEVLLVLDATTGQNAISQADLFNEALEITGIVLCKLDGTARGGIVVAISDEFNIPVKWVGVGEDLEDIAEFDPQSFVDAILG